MKDMVIKLGLHERYRAEVYSPSRSDVEALTARLERL